LIVPALCLSIIDAMYVSKQKLQKASETIASPSSSKIETQMLLNQSCFTDDGFALGIAYVLKVLNQDSKFDALHWFESCENYYRSEKEAAPSAKKDQEEQMLRLKRIEHYEKEFRLLEYVFTGSRAFFSHEDEV
jgi:WASH complex subunit 7